MLNRVFVNIAVIAFAMTLLPVIGFAQAGPSTEATLEQALNKANAKARVLQQQLKTARVQLKQQATQNEQLQARLSLILAQVTGKNDSIGRLILQSAGQLGEAAQLAQTGQQLQNNLTQTTHTLDSTQQQLRQVLYDRQQLTDSRVVRIYQFPLVEAKAILLRNLTKTNSGFLFDHDSLRNVLRITHQYIEKKPGRWIFNRVFETIVEMEVRLVEHTFDPSRTLVYAFTRLRQKRVYIEDYFNEIVQPDQTALYREQSLRLLEGELRNTSDK